MSRNRRRAHPLCPPLPGRQWAVVLLPVLLLGAGCAVVGPDFKRPEPPVPDTWQALADTGREAGIQITTRDAEHAQWWKVFDDPVLNRLIELAYQQNLSLQTAGVRIYQARAQLGIAVGEQFPQSQEVAAGYRGQRVSKNVGVLRDISRVVDVDPSFHVFETGFDAAWELDMWGKFRRGVESAGAALVQQVADYDDVLVSLAGDVASTYTTIRTLQQQLAITRRNVALQKRSLGITRVRFDDGVTTELDVQEATVLLNDTQALIPQITNGLRQAKNALSVLLGMPPGKVDDLVGEPRPIPSPPADVAVGVPAELLRRRPDIRAAELQAAAQSAQIGVAKADLYPSFTLAGAIGVRASDAGDLFSGRSVAGVFNPGITWDVFNYGRIRNNVRVQDARLQELLVNYQNTVLTAYQEVEDALAAFLQDQRQAAYLEKSVRAAKRAGDIAVLQYQDGTADYTRVLNTQTGALRAEDRLVALRGQIVKDLIALYKALGGGWQIRMGRDFIPAATRNAMSERTNWGKILQPEALPADAETLEPPASPPPPLWHPDW